jgi:hypothetical protein
MRLLPRALGVVVVVAMRGFLCLGQGPGTPPFGITANSYIENVLAPYTLAGATYNPSCHVEDGPPAWLKAVSYAIPPNSCGGTYEARDPDSGALYTETAVGQLNIAWVYEGSTALWLSSRGGTADPNLAIGGYFSTELTWYDTLTVTGPPPGTPVTLRFTNFLQNGEFELSGSIVQNSPDLAWEASLVGRVPPASCPQGQAPEATFSYQRVTSTSSPSSRDHIDVCTVSGEPLYLAISLTTSVDASGDSWSATADWLDSVYIDSLTPGVDLRTASRADYGTPNLKVPASSTGCDGKFTGTFYGDLEISVT